MTQGISYVKAPKPRIGTVKERACAAKKRSAALKKFLAESKKQRYKAIHGKKKNS